MTKPLLVLVGFAALLVLAFTSPLGKKSTEPARKRSGLACAAKYQAQKQAHVDQVEREMKEYEEQARKEKAERAANPHLPKKPEEAGVDFKAYDARLAKLDAMPVKELLKSSKDEELAYAVMRRIWKMTTEPSKAQRQLTLIGGLQGQVGNGGFDQYFFNSTGDAALETREGIAAVGDTEALALIDCVFSAFPNSKPDPFRSLRNQQLSAIPEGTFKPLDYVFEFILKKRLDLHMATYLRGNEHLIPAPLVESAVAPKKK